MNALVFMLIPATIGVDFGWERQPDNSIEYILQIEPEALDSMKTGTELVSSLPPQLRNIRDYRIRVGRDPLPNQNKIPPEFGAAGTAGAQPNLATNNYAPATGYPPNTTTTGNYPPPSTSPYPSGTYPTNAYPQNGNSFVNNSAPPGYNPGTYNPGTQFAGGSTSSAGMSPVAGPSTVPTSTSGFPLQPTNATYPTNTTNPTLANLPPPPGSYPNNGYAPTPYPSGTATPAGYNPSGFNAGGYNGTNPYAVNGYAPTNNGFMQPYPNGAYPNQPYQPAPNSFGNPQQQYLAMNGGPAFAGYGAAKPSLNDPTGTAGNFPPGTQFTAPGSNPAGAAPFNTLPFPGTNPSTLPAGGLTAANTQLTNPFVNTGAANNGATGTDPHAAASPPSTQPTTKEPQSQWASTVFILIALFASIGVNIYIFSQNHHLRERCRMLIADRAVY